MRRACRQRKNDLILIAVDFICQYGSCRSETCELRETPPQPRSRTAPSYDSKLSATASGLTPTVVKISDNLTPSQATSGTLQPVTHRKVFTNDVDGMASRSANVKVVGRSTSPLTSKRNLSRLMLG